MATDYFDDPIASRYDVDHAAHFDPAALELTVGVLADLARDGAALELGVGTGRVALPLSGRGVPVHGIDASPAMVARLREKPGADAVGVTIGDFATTRIDGRFTLAYLVFNTIMNLTTQAEQVACFRNAATHLVPGGCFVIEVGIPDLQSLPRGETIRPFVMTPERIDFDEYDVAVQGQRSHHYRVIDGRIHTYSLPFRYVWPAELDLMAQLVGLTLRDRWSDWDRRPFTSESRSHVSVWEKPGEELVSGP